MTTTQPPDKWPGLDADRDGVGYDADKIAGVAKALREIMEPLNPTGAGRHHGSYQDLMTKGSLQLVCDQLRSVDRYESGDQFARTLETAHREFLDVYKDILDNFSTAIALVDAGAGNYSVTNIANHGV